MPIRIPIFLSVIVLLLALTMVANASEKILWVAEYKPDKASQVLLDEELRDWLHQDLDYNIDTVYANTQRAIRMLDEHPNVCVDDKLVTPERREVAYISDLPQVVVPGKRLYFRRDSKYVRKLGALDSEVSLRALMQAYPDLRLGLMAGRQYGERVDDLLDQPSWQSRIWRRSSSYSSDELLQMLIKGRVDATIEYPMVVSNWHSDASGLVSFRLSETQTYTKGHIMCSRSETGNAVIDAVNHWLSRNTQKRRYLELHLKWMDESVRDGFVDDYNRVFSTDFKETNVSQVGPTPVKEQGVNGYSS